MLQRPPESPFPGPNGLEIYKDEVYVANSATGNIVAIAIEDNDDAGQARVHATLPDGQGCDEFVFDVLLHLVLEAAWYPVGCIRFDGIGAAHMAWSLRRQAALRV